MNISLFKLNKVYKCVVCSTCSNIQTQLLYEHSSLHRCNRELSARGQLFEGRIVLSNGSDIFKVSETTR